MAPIHLNLLKIDTEGWEYSVLHGALSSLHSHNIEVIYYECHLLWLQMPHNWTYRDASEFFNAMDYDNYMISNRKRLILLNTPDFYFDIRPDWRNCLAVSRYIDPYRYRAILSYGTDTHPSLVNHALNIPTPC
jgi:hypothetical protein